MLKAGAIFHKRESLAVAVENHGIVVGRKAKFVKRLSCGHGVRFMCHSFDEEKNVDSSCSYSVYFSRSRKKCDNVKLFDEKGNEIDNSVWFIPLKSKICVTHTCLVETNISTRSSIQIMNQIKKNALNAKCNFENFKNSIGGQNIDGIFIDRPHIFKTFKLPKIHLSFEPLVEEMDGKYYNNHHQNNSSKRTPKLIRATSQPPKPRPMADSCDVKSELELWLDDLSAHYASLTISAPIEDTSPPPDPFIVEHELQIEAVKRAVREKFNSESFVFIERAIKTNKNNKISDHWNLECDIECWKQNSKWWDICVSNYPLGHDLIGYGGGWDHENNPYSLYYNDHF
jgi:hypothetical protein